MKKGIIKKILRKIDKKLNKKNKYYWKRKYYKLLKDFKEEKKRYDLLSEDNRRMYAQQKKYQNLYRKWCILIYLFLKNQEEK